MSKERINRAYIDSKLGHILEPMVTQIFTDKPNDYVEYMIKFLKENYGNRPSINQNERLELTFLRAEVKRLQEKLEDEDDDNMRNEAGGGSEDESNASEEDDYIDDLPEEELKKKQKDNRQSVSAEAFGVYHKKGDFKPPVYPKSEELKAKLKLRLEQAFMFSALNQDELGIVIGAMQNVKKNAGDRIITEGDDGQELYVVESGELDCTKVIKGENKMLRSYVPGEAFGELSLLYNCPRAATITAKTDSELWLLDRQTFNHIVKDAAAKKREKYESFLQNVKILSKMNSYERGKLADAIKEEWYNVDDYVIKEGEEGNTFYLVMSGEAIATKTLEPGKPPQEVFRYKSGDYFGERALLQNEPRAANIIAITQLQLVSLDRHSFKRLLGSLHDIEKKYEQ